MSKNIVYHAPFNGTAANLTTLTVLGETAIGVAADQEIVVNVPLSALKECITWDSAWTRPANGIVNSSNPPEVTFALSKLSAAMVADGDGNTAEDRFTATYASYSAEFDDDGNNKRTPIQRYLADALPQVGSKIETIPFEAISKVDVSAMAVTKLSDLSDPDSSVLMDSDVMNLFEQALAAGALGTEADNGSKGYFDNFVVGDSVTIYLNYSVTRTTKLEVDSNVSTNPTTAGLPKFTLADGTVVDTANPIEEVGVAVNKLVAYKFVAAAPAN